MSTAMPFVNPTTTGRGMNFTSDPSPVAPITMSRTPAIIVHMNRPSTPCLATIPEMTTTNAPVGPPIWQRDPRSAEMRKPVRSEYHLRSQGAPALTKWLIVACLLAAAYPAILYPLLVLALARIRRRPWREGAPSGSIAHVITVFNEEKRIREKLLNSLELAVPPGCTMETIVASDGSTDATEEIVREFEPRGVRLLRCPRMGKESAQIAAIRKTDASMLVFSDAATYIEKDALAPLLAPFADPSVRAVSGTDAVTGTTLPNGEDLYVLYEMTVRRSESLAGSLIGLSGCFFATRREVAEAFDPNITSDMGGALLAIRQGGRAVAADTARCRYETARSMGAEFERKRRTVLRGLWCLWEFRDVLVRAPAIVSWQVLSHKWCRFAIPVWLAIAIVLAGIDMVVSQEWLQWELMGFATLGILGLLGLLFPRLRQVPFARAVSFGTISLVAVLFAWADFLQGKAGTWWTPTER